MQTTLSLRRKKLIMTGWGQPSTNSLRKNLAALEKLPFDGVVIEVEGMDDAGKQVRFRDTLGAAAWKEKWFSRNIDDLRAARSQTLTDNFLLVGMNPGDVDWFDDKAWRNVIEHFRIAARVAKQGGAKGILLDCESYTGNGPFKYSMQPSVRRYSFADYCAKTRQRGREAMQAMVREYPDITLFTYFMNSYNILAAQNSNPQESLRASVVGLYPAFIDGWLDAATLATKIIDGCENAYRFNSEAEFTRAASLVKGDCQNIVAPENRARYRAQVQVGFGIYLDAHTNPEGSVWYVANADEPRVHTLQTNVTTALRTADEYVWVYGEGYRWGPPPDTENGRRLNPKQWDEAFPGLEDALWFARNPAEAARRKVETMRTHGGLTNLLRNGDFDGNWTGEGNAGGWYTWQHDPKQGTFTWDDKQGASTTSKPAPGAVRITNMGPIGGAIIQPIDVKPRENYLVTARLRQTGVGQGLMRIRWQDAKGDWMVDDQDVLFFEDASNSPHGWKNIGGVVRVPTGVGKLVVLLAGQDQPTANDSIWFDTVAVHKVN